MKSKTYGLAPANTTLTIKYRYGGAVEHNVKSNSLNSAKDTINYCERWISRKKLKTKTEGNRIRFWSSK